MVPGPFASDVAILTVCFESQLSNPSELLLSSLVIKPFTVLSKRFLAIAQPGIYSSEGEEKQKEKVQEVANFFLTPIISKVQVVSFHTNRYNEARNEAEIASR